ncbi:hypothetical protein N3K66_000330 [Trichothecium roseum]|uniref:Uncharacterized protein n=1 Tax=Trichothecium roseum TaxID=47278 RepID=A0ACC0VD39_9HYPO|nr:hypothetical protein N3K66_000330 [Trichothecium roseum]
MAGRSFTRSLAQEIPSCVQSCFIDGLARAGCDEGDYECWCSEANHQVAAKTMNGCFFEDRTTDEECSGRDVFTLDNVYQLICQDHGSPIGQDPSLPTVQYNKRHDDNNDNNRHFSTLAKRDGGKLTVGQKAGIIVGSTLFGIVCCFLLYFFLRRRSAAAASKNAASGSGPTMVSRRSTANDQSAAERGDGALAKPRGKVAWELRSKLSSKLSSGLTLQGGNGGCGGGGDESQTDEIKKEKTEAEKEKNKEKRTSLWRPSGEFEEVFKEELRKAELEQQQQEQAGNKKLEG